MASLKIVSAVLGVVAVLAAGGCERRVGPTAAMEGRTETAPAADSGVAKPEPDRTATPETGAAGTSAAPGASRESAAGSQASTRRPSLSAGDIRRLQQELKSKGHDPGPVDGIMGPMTRAALRAFQRAQGLESNGTLDRQTAAALGM